nr:hypothetical protein [Tanacetum cinerariifolium]
MFYSTYKYEARNELELWQARAWLGSFPPLLLIVIRTRPYVKNVVADKLWLASSFCCSGIRDLFISKRTCVCGATDRLADELLPNKTLRETIIVQAAVIKAKSLQHLYPQKIKKPCVSQQEPLEITKAPDVTESNMKAPASEGRALPADKEP